MKNKFYPTIISLIILLISTYCYTQTTQLPSLREISRDSLLIYARTIIDSSESHVLVTVDEEGIPQARTMAPFPPEEDWIIWFGTFPTSRKVKQIQNNPNVVVFYYDSDSRSYVSVSGKAQIVNDSALKEKYWKSGWKKFYPDKETQYVLIEVTPVKLEICSFKYNLLWDAEGKPAFVGFELNDNK